MILVGILLLLATLAVLAWLCWLIGEEVRERMEIEGRSGPGEGE